MELEAIEQWSPYRGLQPARVSKGSTCYNRLFYSWIFKVGFWKILVRAQGQIEEKLVKVNTGNFINFILFSVSGWKVLSAQVWGVRTNANLHLWRWNCHQSRSFQRLSLWKGGKRQHTAPLVRHHIIIITRRCGTLCGPSSSSCVGLWPLASAFFLPMI